MPIADHPETAQLRGLEEWIEAEAIAHPAFGRVRIGGNGRDLDPADIVVEGEVADGEVAQRIAAGARSWRSRDSADRRRRYKEDDS